MKTRDSVSKLGFRVRAVMLAAVMLSVGFGFAGHDAAAGLDSGSLVRATALGEFRTVTPGLANDSGEPSDPAAIAMTLAQGIVHPPTLLAGVHSVEEALSRSGIATGTSEGILVPARSPATPEVDLPMGVLSLALEARGGTVYRMTAADLGDMLADFGWPFAAAPSRGDQVVAMLAVMIDGARADPRHPVSFAPLLLDELTQLKDPPFDLDGGTLAPEEVRLSLLDLKLIAAIFDRTSIKSTAPAGVVAAANEPCTDAKKWISGATGPFGGQIYGLSTSQTGPGLVDKGLEAAGVSKGNAAAAGAALGAVSIAAKLWKLLEFYSNAKVNVTLDDGPKITHKWLEEDALQLRLFKATTGVSEKDWKEYVDSFSNVSQDTNKSVRDCLNEFGLSVPADLGEIVKDAENWKIDWSIRSGFNGRNEPNAFWSLDSQLPPGAAHLGRWRSSPTKVSDYSAQASFVVDIGTERETDHPSTQKLDNVNVCADVVAASPPSLSTFFGATQGIIGLVDAITELAAGWLQTIAPPSACAVIGVTWHEKACPGLSQQSVAALQIVAAAEEQTLPCKWTGTLSGTHNYTQGNYLAQNWQGTAQVIFTLKSVFRVAEPPSVSYTYAVSGTANWGESGFMGNCDYSRSGNDPLGLGGGLTISSTGSGPWKYLGNAFVDIPDPGVCDETQNYGTAVFNMFLVACIQSTGYGTYSGTGGLNGSCAINSSGGNSTETQSYQWQLSPEACLPELQPVCGP